MTNTPNPQLEQWAKNEAKKYNRVLTEIKKNTKNVNYGNLIAMSSTTDPYYMTKGKMLKAHWAREITDTVLKPYLRENSLSNTHLRDLHYILLSQHTLTADGGVYSNTPKNWGDLIQAFSIGRYLDFVDWSLIKDEKNKLDVNINYREYRTFDQSIKRAQNNIDIDKIINDAFVSPFNHLLNHWVYQPVLIEIWSEKSLSLLDNLVSKYNINLVTGEGETSVTMVYKLIERIKDAKRPCRIAYLSDCDVVGYQMVKSMSRKVEFLLQEIDFDIDVKVIPLMLTSDQVKHLNLPIKPMKPSTSLAYEKRKELFYESRGMHGAVEINALTAQHPDYFNETLEDFIQAYINIDLWNDILDYQEKIPEIIKENLQTDRLDNDAFKEMLSEVIDSIDWDDLKRDHDDEVDDFTTRVFDYETYDKDQSFLFDSDLEYFEQLGKYKYYDEGKL